MFFESGDKLAALYSIHINNPTIFGGKNVAQRNSQFGVYIPRSFIKIEQSGRGKRGRKNDIDNIYDFLGTYADTTALRASNVVGSDVSFESVELFFERNIIDFYDIAKEILNIQQNSNQFGNTILTRNRAFYTICLDWIHSEIVNEIENSHSETYDTSMFFFADFIIGQLNAIVSSKIIKEALAIFNVDHHKKDVLTGWIYALYPHQQKDQQTNPHNSMA